MTTYDLLKSAAEDTTVDPRMRYFLNLQQFTLGFLNVSEFEDLAQNKPTMTQEDWQKEYDLVIKPHLFHSEEPTPELNILYPNARQFINLKEELLTYALNNNPNLIFSKKDYVDNSNLTMIGQIPRNDSDNAVIPVFDCTFYEDRGYVDCGKYLFSRTYQPVVLEQTHLVENCMLVMLSDDFEETSVPTLYSQSIDKNGIQLHCHVVPVIVKPEIKEKYGLPQEVSTLLCVMAYKNGNQATDVISYLDLAEYDGVM